MLKLKRPLLSRVIHFSLFFALMIPNAVADFFPGGGMSAPWIGQNMGIPMSGNMMIPNHPFSTIPGYFPGQMGQWGGGFYQEPNPWDMISAIYSNRGTMPVGLGATIPPIGMQSVLNYDGFNREYPAQKIPVSSLLE
jgi:hypothetical protein